jgi:hypothetical protein
MIKNKIGVAMKFVLCLVTLSVQCDPLQTIKEFCSTAQAKAFFAGLVTTATIDVGARMSDVAIWRERGERNFVGYWTLKNVVLCVAAPASVVITLPYNSDKSIGACLKQLLFGVVGALTYQQIANRICKYLRPM